MPGCRVYICDDDPDYRYLLRAVLELQGAEIVGEAGDGPECVREAPALDPAVVLVDSHMPTAMAQTLPRVRERLPGARVIVLSTSGAPETRERALALGAHGVVKKALDIFEMPVLLREQIRG